MIQQYYYNTLFLYLKGSYSHQKINSAEQVVKNNIIKI